MKQIIVKLRDNTEIEMYEQYGYASTYREVLDDTRYNFIQVGNYVFAKDVIASLHVEEIKEKEE